MTWWRIRRHRSRSTLAQLITCYLKQCWRPISGALRCSHESNFIASTQVIILYNEFEKKNLPNYCHISQGQRVKITETMQHIYDSKHNKYIICLRTIMFWTKRLTDKNLLPDYPKSRLSVSGVFVWFTLLWRDHVKVCPAATQCYGYLPLSLR